MPFYRFALPFLAAVLLAACAAPSSPERRPINKRPKYGGVLKTESQKQVDQQLIEDTLAYGVSLEEGARLSVAKGWEYLDAGQPGLAMRRFNQAWLLDRGNAGAYWGMAAVVWERDRSLAQADHLFWLAEALDPDNPDLQVDFGRLYGGAGKPEKALARYRRALKLDPAVRDGLRNMAVAHLDLGQIAEACRFAARGARKDNRWKPGSSTRSGPGAGPVRRAAASPSRPAPCRLTWAVWPLKFRAIQAKVT